LLHVIAFTPSENKNHKKPKSDHCKLEAVCNFECSVIPVCLSCELIVSIMMLLMLMRKEEEGKVARGLLGFSNYHDWMALNAGKFFPMFS
jgi:hypothetical protein